LLKDVNDVEKSRDFCQIFESFGFGQFGLGKKGSVSISEKFGLGKSLSFGKFGIAKKVSVSVSIKILVLSFSGTGQ